MSERRLEVRLSGTLVGLLVARSDGHVSFRFDEAYRSDPEHPVLGQAFEDDLSRSYVGNAPGALPGFFANLLPEGALRGILERSLEGSAPDDVALLAALGDDLPGAIRVRAVSEGAEPTQAAPSNTSRESADEESPPLRFSLAGVQLKFSMLADGERLTLPAHGEDGDWIVKLGSPDFPHIVENEHATMEWARACALDVPECRLVDAEALEGLPRRHAPDGQPVLAIRRFDRPRAGARVHQEDFAQVMGRTRAARGNGRYKYDSKLEALAILVRTIVGDDAYLELVRRIAFVVASGNNDAHLKNWSLQYPDGRSARLSPVYDQLVTVAWPQHDRELALKLAGTRRPGEIDAARLRHLARSVGAEEQATIDAAMDTVTRARDTWASVMRPRIPAEEHRRELLGHWQRVPLLRAAGTLR